jgi:hypothetical protein
MSDEFPETDLDTPSADEIDKAYGSRFLGVVDVGDKKIRTKITKVRMEEVKNRDTGKSEKKPLVYFENIDKPLILIKTNKDTLVAAFGEAPASWLGATVGIFVDPSVMFSGKRTGGVRLRALLPAPAAKPMPKPVPVQTAKPAAAAWPEEKGDPGPDLG